MEEAAARNPLPLHFPIVLDRETPDVLFTAEIAAIACGMKQELFLDLWSQVSRFMIWLIREGATQPSCARSL